MLEVFWQKITSSKSSIFFYCLILFIAGIFSGYFLSVPHFYLFSVMLILLFLILILSVEYKTRSFYFFIFLFSYFLIFGLWCYNVALPDFKNIDKIYHYGSTTVEFIGAVKKIDSRLTGQKLIVASELLKKNSEYKKISGNVYISQELYPQYRINEKIRVSCYLQYPGLIEDFDWGKYLAKDKIYVTCGFAEIYSISSPSNYSFSYHFSQLKKYLIESLNASMSEPQVSLMRGILLGDSRGLPEKYSLMFSDLGLTHIIAISGDHIAIIAAVLLQLLIAFGISRPKAFWPLAVIIGFYVLLVGAPASAVRAAIMALAVMYAQKIGRGSQIKNVLVLTATLMILVNPKILLSDVGFQLSFMAVWGLSYISPLLTAKMQKLPDIFRIKEIVFATISAQIATLPLLLFYFGKLSLVSILANILILPIIPFLTIWGLANLIISAIYLPLGQLMGYVSWLLCAYWIEISGLLHRIPFGYFNLGNFGVVELVVSYCVIFFFWYKISD